jgi:two-component SAPR family response regulator
VDNDARVVDLLTSLLTADLSATVDEAPLAQAAIELLCERRYDLVFIDSELPDLHGARLVERIREGKVHAGVRTVPIILMHTQICRGGVWKGWGRLSPMEDLLKPFAWAYTRDLVTRLLQPGEGEG